MSIELPPHMQLAVMSRGYVVSRAIHAVARLGVADHLLDTPTSIEKLAKSTGTIPERLDRLLTFLCDYGIFNKSVEGYSLTPLSYPLQQNNPKSMKHVLSMVDESWWEAFSSLEEGLKTGVTPFVQRHNTDFFSSINSTEKNQNLFKNGMDKLSAIDDQSLLDAFNFSQFKSLVDIGYGGKNLIKAIQEHTPKIETSVFKVDPSQINKNKTVDFTNLETASAYLLKGILHDFNDELTKQILNSLADKIPDDSTLLIAEQIIPDNNQPHTNKTMDIIMMVLVGGKQRTLKGWIDVACSAGFHFKNAYPSNGLFTIMEFSPLPKSRRRHLNQIADSISSG